MPNKKGTKQGFGSLRTLPSGRIQARYTGPDKLSHTAPVTFETKGDAETWLATMRADIVRGLWRPRGKGAPRTLADYAGDWLEYRNLKPRTRAHYKSLLAAKITPFLGSIPLKDITPETIRRWHAELTKDGTPTTTAHAYGLLRSILATAVTDDLIPANPAHIRGAGSSKRVKKIKPLALTELEKLVAAMPDRYKAMTLMAAWCGLRFGELTELRRGDVDLKNGLIRVRRAVVHLDGKAIVGTPKSDAGIRDVAIPPHLLPLLKTHIKEHGQPGKQGLLFPSATGGHLAPSSLYGRPPTKKRAGWGFYAARAAAGRKDLRWHDLRHGAAIMAAQSGATLAELMNRLGHSTPAAALRYQHAAQDRDMQIAKALSAMVDS
jgi:integrase